MGLQFLDIPKMVCVCVQDMKQTLFVACFGARSCCFAAARCFSSRKSKAHPLYSGQRPWTDLHTYAQGRTTGVHRLDKGRSGNSPWNTGFKVLAGWEGGQTYNQLEISWKKGIGNLDAFPFLFFKKNFDSETASGSAQILSETTSWTFQRWSYHPEQDAECSRSHLIALPSHQLFQGEPPFLYQRPPLLFLNIQLCMGLQLEHIGCCPKRLRLWRGGQGWESETQVSIGTGSLGLACCWGRPGCSCWQEGQGGHAWMDTGKEPSILPAEPPPGHLRGNHWTVGGLCLTMTLQGHGGPTVREKLPQVHTSQVEVEGLALLDWVSVTLRKLVRGTLSWLIWMLKRCAWGSGSCQ